MRTTTPSERIARLIAVRGILSMHMRAEAAQPQYGLKAQCQLNGETRGFHIHSWECGTVACAAGSAALHPWFIERGFYMRKAMLSCDRGVVCYQDERGWEAVKAFFGLNTHETFWVFSGEKYPKLAPVIPKQVRDRVDFLIIDYGGQGAMDTALRLEKRGDKLGLGIPPHAKAKLKPTPNTNLALTA